MPLIINMRHLAERDLHLRGDLPVSELDLGVADEMVRAEAPLEYDVEAQHLQDSLLVRGRLRLNLNCRCVRCLNDFVLPLELSPWTCHLPLHGDERVAVVNDCVDLTPRAREDILLEFPRHPLCKPECTGLIRSEAGSAHARGARQAESSASAWDALDKLKL